MLETGPSLNWTQGTLPSTQAKAAGGRYFSVRSNIPCEQSSKARLFALIDCPMPICRSVEHPACLHDSARTSHTTHTGETLNVVHRFDISQLSVETKPLVNEVIGNEFCASFDQMDFSVPRKCCRVIFIELVVPIEEAQRADMFVVAERLRDLFGKPFRDFAEWNGC